MHISNIPNLLISPLTGAIHYFKESSWKGRTVQIVLTVSLIYLFVRSRKALARSSITPMKRASNLALQRASVKPEGGKLVPATYKDKAFVQALFQRIGSSGESNTALKRELEKVKEREFDNPNAYIQYLFPDSTQDIQVLGIARSSIGFLGLFTMEDLGILGLRDFDQHFVTLRQLCTCLQFELQGGEISSQLRESFWAEIKKFRDELNTLKSSPITRLGLKVLFGWMDTILASLTPENPSDLLSKIEELENFDRMRQRILLKKYIQQPEHADAWIALREQSINTLSQYGQTYGALDNPHLLYQLATHLGIIQPGEILVHNN